MSNRISGILIVTLIALCAIVVMEARSGIPSADSLKVSPQEGTAETVAGPVRVTLPPLGAFSETVERPLFIESRRPPEIEPGEVPASPATVLMGPREKFVLSAIVITDDERAVLIANPQSGEPIRLAEGESIAGWRLDRVETERAVFSKDGEIREVALRTFEPPPPARPQRPSVIAPEATSAEEALRRALRGNGLGSFTSKDESGSGQ